MQEFVPVLERPSHPLKRAAQWASRVLRSTIWGKEQAARNKRFSQLASIALGSLAGPKEWGPRHVSVPVGPETRIVLEDRPTPGLTLDDGGFGFIDRKGPRLTIFQQITFMGGAALERTIFVPQYGGGVKVETATGQLTPALDRDGNRTFGFRADFVTPSGRLSADQLVVAEALLDRAQLHGETPSTRVDLAVALSAQMLYAGKDIAVQ